MAAREHRYRITLEHLATPREDMERHAPLVFEDCNHDDIFRIVELQRRGGRFASEDEAAAFALGLKLLSEAVLRNRQYPLPAAAESAYRGLHPAAQGGRCEQAECGCVMERRRPRTAWPSSFLRM